VRNCLFFSSNSAKCLSSSNGPEILKAESPFGQLPFLDHGDFKLGQSMAIARFAARKADLSGDNDHDFAMSEQLIEEQNDLYNVLAKAHYERVAALPPVAKYVAHSPCLL